MIQGLKAELLLQASRHQRLWKSCGKSRKMLRSPTFHLFVKGDPCPACRSRPSTDCLSVSNKELGIFTYQATSSRRSIESGLVATKHVFIPFVGVIFSPSRTGLIHKSVLAINHLCPCVPVRNGVAGHASPSNRLAVIEANLSLH